jgi:alkylated DNA nucleotide flippase Atl1
MASLGNARQMCRWLCELPSDSVLPWHRLVSAQGKSAEFSNVAKPRHMFEAEGIAFSDNGWPPKHYYIQNFFC